MPYNEKEYQKTYKQDHYDPVCLRLPKGIKDRITAAASLKGMSVNKFIVDCILSAINQDRQSDPLPWAEDPQEVDKSQYGWWDKVSMTNQERLQARFNWQRQHTIPLVEDENDPLPF